MTDLITYIWIGIALWILDVIYDPKFHIEQSNDVPVPYGLAMIVGILLWPIGLVFFTWQTVKRLTSR